MHQSRQKEREGIVVSNRMQKTAVVSVERIYSHPVYKKVVRKSQRYKVHDEKNAMQIGDRVRIVETRPLSRGKGWRLLEILGHGEAKKRELPAVAHKREKEKAEGTE